MRTTASIFGHPVHMMLVHFPMAFLIGGFGFDVAAALGIPVPPVVGATLVAVGLPTGFIAMLPGIVDLATTVRRLGGRAVGRTLRHAVLAFAAFAAFGAASRQRPDLLSPAPAGVLLLELLGVALLTLSAMLGGALVLDDKVGVRETGA